MYQAHPYLGYLGDLGGILSMASIPSVGSPVTFTFQKGGWVSFDFSSDTEILQGLRERISNYGDVIKVSRPLFSNRYVITILPSTSVSISEWLNAFDTIWKDMGYDNITFLQAEGGSVSTEPGGVSQIGQSILPDVGGAVGSTVSSIIYPIIGPLLPYVLILGGVYLLLKVGIPEYTKTK